MSILPSGITVELASDGVASRYASKLLADLGAKLVNLAGPPELHPALRFAESGLMAITGAPGKPPLMCPVPLASCGDGALTAFRALSGQHILPGLYGGNLMAERAAIFGHQRRGSTSAGGSCRLLATQDGQIAVNLARDSDWGLTPAWLQVELLPDWAAVSAAVARRCTAELLTQGRLLGLAVADAAAPLASQPQWLTVARRGTPAAVRNTLPRVLDLSSLWAGPLCSHLWQLAGATVIKLESTQRPDGTRYGHPQFFDLLNNNKQTVALDLHTASGRQQLRELIHQVDIVIEGSRPRALRQMGIVAEELLAEIPGLSWIGISGYGRPEPQANWIAYGDDAGVAAGLSSIMHRACGEWVFCGDAIADPLTGLHAALAGWASWLAGGGHLIDLSLHQVVQHCVTATDDTNGQPWLRYDLWCRQLVEQQILVKPPTARLAPQSGTSAGALPSAR